jgi:tetratricopeptide (TPR) repeat protein
LLAFLFLLVVSLLTYMLLSQLNMGWVVIALLSGMLVGLVFMLWRQSARPEIRFLNQANRLYLAQEYEAAINFCQKSLERRPDQAQAYNLLATCHANLEQFNEALACYRRLAELQPFNASAYSNIASIAYRLEPVDLEEIQESLDKAWELTNHHRPTYTTYFTLLKIAFTELEVERYKESIRASNAALRLRPGTTTPLLVRGLATLLVYSDDPAYTEQGRSDLITFLRRGFDTNVSLKQEIQLILKAREFLLETGGLPEDLEPRINNSEY